MIKGVIFDADGTLLDSMTVWHSLGKRYLETLGIAVDDELSEILYPMSFDEGCRYLKESYDLSSDISMIAEDIREMIRDFYSREVTLKAGVRDYLDYLKEKGIPMIVVTVGDKELIKAAFKRTGVEDCFCDIIACDELKLTKREPTVYIEAAKRLGATPFETVVLEDTLYCIENAGAAGFITVAVEDAFNQNEGDSLKATADYFIKDFTDKLLKKLI